MIFLNITALKKAFFNAFEKTAKTPVKPLQNECQILTFYKIIMYAIAQQVTIIKNCKTATELVTARQELESLYSFSDLTFAMFKIKLQQLFLNDKI